jgi:hypothetical protein
MTRRIYFFPALLLLFCLNLSSVLLHANEKRTEREFYQIRLYHFRDAAQETMIDNYLQSALLPALHRAGIARLGVYKSLANDTATDKQIYLLVPYKTLEQMLKMEQRLGTDANYLSTAADFLHAPFDKAPYTRIEIIWLQAFPLAPQIQSPQLSGALNERIYELRSYESPTVDYHQNKVKMFNDGGEIALFGKLGFNAVFYASVLSGSHLPNLMYMTCFENMAAREAHWKSFVESPEWKKLSALPEYQHNVSKIDIVFLHPAAYSDL